MKAKEKKYILILIIVSIVIIGAIFLVTRPKKQEVNNDIIKENIVTEEFTEILGDGTKLNTSSKLTQTRTINGLEIKNIQLTVQNNETVLLADVENVSSKDVSATQIDITLLDKDNNEMATIPGIISPVKVGEKVQLNSSIIGDYSNTCDFKVVFK